MENLDQIGVQEMEVEEMVAVDGGVWGGVFKELFKGFLSSQLIEQGIEVLKDAWEALKNSDYEMPDWQRRKMSGL